MLRSRVVCWLLKQARAVVDENEEAASSNRSRYEARHMPSAAMASRAVAPRARAAGSPTTATQRTEDRAPFASLSDLFEELHRKARRCSQQATWHRGARRSQAGSCHRARRSIFSGPLAVGRSRELSPRPPTLSCSSNHGELHVGFRNDVACVEQRNATAQPVEQAHSRARERHGGSKFRLGGSIGGTSGSPRGELGVSVVGLVVSGMTQGCVIHA